MATRTYSRQQAGTPEGGRFRTTGRKEPETVLGLPVEEADEQIQKSVRYWGGRRMLTTDARQAAAQDVWTAALAADARKTFDGENPCGYIHSLARNVTAKAATTTYATTYRSRGLTRPELSVATRMEALAAKTRPATPAGWDELYDRAVADLGGMRAKAPDRAAVSKRVRDSLPGGASDTRIDRATPGTAFGELVGGGTREALQGNVSKELVQQASDDYFERELPDEAPKGEIWNHLTPDVRPITPKSVALRTATKHRRTIQAAGGALSIARRLLDGPVDRDTERAFCAPWGRLDRSEQVDVADALVRNPSLANRMWAVALRAAESRTS